MAFREVGVHEVREVLRLWLRGDGIRSVARLAQVDRKTAAMAANGSRVWLPQGTRKALACGATGRAPCN